MSTKATGKLTVVIAIAIAVLCMLTSCADNRTPAEKLMDYVSKNGGTGSVESSVGIALPVKDAGAICKLKLSATDLQIDYVAPQDGIVSGVQLDDSLTLKVSLDSGSAEWSREATMWVLGSQAKSYSQGDFDAAALSRNAMPDVRYTIVTIDGKKVNTSGSDDPLKEAVAKERDDALDCLSKYLEQSGTKLTLADFGFASF